MNQEQEMVTVKLSDEFTSRNSYYYDLLNLTDNEVTKHLIKRISYSSQTELSTVWSAAYMIKYKTKIELTNSIIYALLDGELTEKSVQVLIELKKHFKDSELSDEELFLYAKSKKYKAEHMQLIQAIKDAKHIDLEGAELIKTVFKVQTKEQLTNIGFLVENIRYNQNINRENLEDYLKGKICQFDLRVKNQKVYNKTENILETIKMELDIYTKKFYSGGTAKEDTPIEVKAHIRNLNRIISTMTDLQETLLDSHERLRNRKDFTPVALQLLDALEFATTQSIKASKLNSIISKFNSSLRAYIKNRDISLMKESSKTTSSFMTKLKKFYKPRSEEYKKIQIITQEINTAKINQDIETISTYIAELKKEFIALLRSDEFKASKAKSAPECQKHYERLVVLFIDYSLA